MSDVMERLARANPTPTDEPPSAEERREAHLLLERILAEPIAPGAPPARRIPVLRRVAPAAGLLAALGIAVAVVIDLVGSEKRSGGIVERAVAAVSQEDVIYAITERGTGTTRPLQPGLGPPSRERGLRRIWVWGAGDRARFLTYTRHEGAWLRSEMILTPERVVWFDAQGKRRLTQKRELLKKPPPGYLYFDPFANPAEQLREHVENDRLRVEGKTTVRGRTAYRLVSRPYTDRDAGIERQTVTYLVDARTYLPLQLRTRGVSHADGAPGSERLLITGRAEYLHYEALPVTEENKRLLEKGGGRRP